MKVKYLTALSLAIVTSTFAIQYVKPTLMPKSYNCSRQGQTSYFPDKDFGLPVYHMVVAKKLRMVSNHMATMTTPAMVK